MPETATLPFIDPAPWVNAEGVRHVLLLSCAGRYCEYKPRTADEYVADKENHG